MPRFDFWVLVLAGCCFDSNFKLQLTTKKAITNKFGSCKSGTEGKANVDGTCSEVKWKVWRRVFLLQTTIESNKMFDLILTMICDNATLFTSFPLLEHKIRICSFFDLKVLWLQSGTIDTDAHWNQTCYLGLVQSRKQLSLVLILKKNCWLFLQLRTSTVITFHIFPIHVPIRFVSFNCP